MQNQQIQQNPQNGTQPFFPMGQGPNNFDPRQIGSENNFNAPDSNIDTQQGSEISSQIGEAAIGASQAESPIPGVQEPLDMQTPPNADDNTQESALNPEIGGMYTKAADIIPFPARESQSSKYEQNTDGQTQTDGLPHMALDNRRDSLSKENQKIVKKLMDIAPEDPSKFYREATGAREEYSEWIRGKAA